MSDQFEFGFFDKKAGIEASRRYLPHWFQPNVAVFLTFRTADSLPADVLLLWEREQREWLLRNGWKIGESEPLPAWDSLPESIQKHFRKHRESRWHGHLDDCHGECLLRQRELADVVATSLLHFDGQRYDTNSAARGSAPIVRPGPVPRCRST